MEMVEWSLTKGMDRRIGINMEWSPAGMDGMEWTEDLEWNGMDGMDGRGSEWNGSNG